MGRPKGIRPPAHAFKPGNPGGPGAPKLSPETKAIRSMTADEFYKIANRIFFATSIELKAIIDDPSTSMLELYIARIIQDGSDKKDKANLNYFVERFLGKVPEKTEVSGNLNAGIVDIIRQIREKRERQIDDKD